MYQTKQDLLRGHEKINQFDQQHCIALIPSSEIFPIDFTYNGRYFHIVHMIDRLLSRWLKLRKYFIMEDQNWCVCAFLFLQPIWDNVFTVGKKLDWKFECRPDREFLEQPDWIFEATYTNLTPKSSTRIYMPFAFPFLFLLTRANSSFLQESDLICRHRSRNQIYFKLLPTKNPSIYLLIFSNILKTEKDCAKLLRSYLKNPQVISIASFEISITCSYENLRISHLFQYMFDSFDKSKFADRDLNRATSNFPQLVFDDAQAQYNIARM